MTGQGDVCWADLGPARGSGPANHRPVVIVQSDRVTDTGIDTTVTCIMTAQLRRAGAPGNVFVSSTESGLPKDSVVNVTQIATLDIEQIGPPVGRVSDATLRAILAGIVNVVLAPPLSSTGRR